MRIWKIVALMLISACVSTQEGPTLQQRDICSATYYQAEGALYYCKHYNECDPALAEWIDSCGFLLEEVNEFYQRGGDHDDS